ncbi:hypothetical protein Rsub_05756 [Raphidocelis subcapitata]|uniref:Uncharacterized protein n=1 Tax=Raphidocelis subcapitata TaxID=307507 RepID=A0A2V0P4Z0_9CHLO|nr:hypothetical protein Rsub_05756 [Raphidocelis subcapitata]|eukprot:GBF92920.1 hypothetical protein Rsub_05756 [Raphidocelis subcapitata]
MEGEGGDVMVSMDFSELEGMLRPILADAVQDAPSTSGMDADQVTQRALAKLWKLIHDSNEDRAGHLAGVPLPEVDAELLPLQQEVDAVLSRLNARRLGVPPLVEASTRAELEKSRPAPLADADEPAEDAADAGAAPMETDDTVALLRRTTATSDRLPAIRARLEEALHRLQTNLSVLGDGEPGARASPRTVEKVMRAAARTRPADDQRAEEEAAAAEGEEGGESGADATRRCLARELA